MAVKMKPFLFQFGDLIVILLQQVVSEYGKTGAATVRIMDSAVFMKKVVSEVIHIVEQHRRTDNSILTQPFLVNLTGVIQTTEKIINLANSVSKLS